MVTLFWFTKHNKDQMKMLILVHRDKNVLYVWLVSSKCKYMLQSYGKSPITSGSPLVCSENKDADHENKGVDLGLGFHIQKAGFLIT